MTVIISFKPSNEPSEPKSGPHRIVNVMAILTTQYCTKFVTRNNRVQSFENCDIENVFLENMGK